MMNRILIISSQVHKELSTKQLNHCVELVKKTDYQFEVDIVDAGTYEIPFLIQAHQITKRFDGFIALGLLLKSDQDHFDYIQSHIKTCFSQFALNQVIVGNGIISGSTLDELAKKIDSSDSCLSAYPSAFRAVDALIRVKQRLAECASGSERLG